MSKSVKKVKKIKKTSKKQKKNIVIYTDGSCSNNGKTYAVGGIGIHFPNGELKDVSKIFSLGCCTNQRTELYAILTALRYIKQNLGLSRCKVLVKTDSQYSIDCVTKWVYGWIKNGWKTKNGTPVANKEIIEIIHKYYETYDIIFEHVDAHTCGTDEESIANAVADTLAVNATKKALLSQKNSNKKGSVTKKYSGSKSNKNNTNINKKSNNYHLKYRTGCPIDNNIIVELVKSKN
jgi:ribonuclease HI